MRNLDIEDTRQKWSTYSRIGRLTAGSDTELPRLIEGDTD